MSEDDRTITLANGTVAPLRWDDTESRYVGICPKCGGTFRIVAHDDGDGMWDECCECQDCDWECWL